MSTSIQLKETASYREVDQTTCVLVYGI